MIKLCYYCIFRLIIKSFEMSSLKEKMLAFGLIVGFYSSILAQNMSLDFTFNGGSGFDNFVRTSNLLSDGKILVGGYFTNFNGVSVNHIARLHVNGTLDTTFEIGTGFDGDVLSSHLQSDGKILVCGHFSKFNGISMKLMARLNSDGTLDQSFNLGASSGYIVAIETQPDGKILVGGYFTTNDGTTVKGVTRLNPDGSADPTFNIGSGFNSGASSLCLQSNGKILVGGSFSTYNGLTCNRIARLNIDGTLDTTFNTGTGFDQTPNIPQVSVIVQQTNEKIIVGGQFNIFNGVPVSHFLRLNTDGSLDTTFTTGTGFDYNIWHVNLQDDGRIIVGGCFNKYNGHAINGIVRLNSDGSFDSDFINGTGFDGCLYDSFYNADGSLLVAGYFATYNGIQKKHLAKLYNCLADSIEITSFVTPSDTNVCNGQFAININGSAPYEIYVDNNSQAIVCSDYLLLQNQCPGKHELRILGGCGDSLITQYFIPTNTNYVFINPFLDSLALDSLGVLLTNCNINYNSIDTAYIDSIWVTENIVTVVWNIVDVNGANLDTISYVLNEGNGVYWIQISILCPNKSIESYFSATEAIYFSNNSVSIAGLTDFSELNPVIIFPNPTNDLVEIHFEESNVRLRIFNSRGKILDDRTIISGEIISLSNFESGIYFFELLKPDGMTFVRVVKN
jgi:uncharacterized delta-60 repeat protein